MSKNRLFTPIAASVVAGIFVALAAVGESLTGDSGAAAKADHFAGIGDTLCASQQDQSMSSECMAWSEDEMTDGAVRYVTVASSDLEAGMTTLNRVKVTNEAF